MIVILDSNEYINFLNGKELSLNKILDRGDISVHINNTIIREVLRNVDIGKGKIFYNLILNKNIVFSYEPADLIRKYKKFGMKKGDFLIAALCEHTNADYLITENRHFLKSKGIENLRILSLKEFLKLLN